MLVEAISTLKGSVITGHSHCNTSIRRRQSSIESDGAVICLHSFLARNVHLTAHPVVSGVYQVVNNHLQTLQQPYKQEWQKDDADVNAAAPPLINQVFMHQSIGFMLKF